MFGYTSNLLFTSCLSEQVKDPIASPTLSDPTETTEPTELIQSQHCRGLGAELEDCTDELLSDDLCSELGDEDDEDDDVYKDDEKGLCRNSCEAEDPFYDRAPLFSVVGRLVRFQEHAGKGN